MTPRSLPHAAIRSRSAPFAATPPAMATSVGLGASSRDQIDVEPIEELIDERVLKRGAEIGERLRIAGRADAVLAREADRAGLDAGVREVEPTLP